jgi:predicted NUDIX family NTP pyrophosphohydrolase
MATLMVAQVLLYRQGQASDLPKVPPGSLFWARDQDVPWLLADGNAVLAPEGATLPAEPPWTVRGRARIRLRDLELLTLSPVSY